MYDIEDEIDTDSLIAKFEATVAVTIASGAKDRATAIRWLLTAQDDPTDVDYFEYINGLPLGYLSRKGLT